VCPDLPSSYSTNYKTGYQTPLILLPLSFLIDSKTWKASVKKNPGDYHTLGNFGRNPETFANDTHECTLNYTARINPEE
jgi:hypothetical protein